ncbi:MAG: Fic family protein [Thermoleophilia bacterium]|nr:Fic family protein [Thermoleophilia bacterium]
MLHATPILNSRLSQLLAELDRLRARLGVEAGSSVPWDGTIRREARYESISGSTAIEGFHVEESTGHGLISGDVQATTGDDNELAVAHYARAMDHVAILAAEPEFEWHRQVIVDLHFDACAFHRDKRPGRWRDGAVFVRGNGGAIAYEAPPADTVSDLMREVVEWLRDGDLDAHVAVRAAMAHLHVVSVHPFRDGNGRTSRIVQSLVLARAGLLSPELGSIEPYLAAHTRDYFAQLQAAHGGVYDPSIDAGDWVEFCVRAHIEQAVSRLAMYERAAARWAALTAIIDGGDWPERMIIALEQALFGGTSRSSYAREADVHPNTARSDLQQLMEAGHVDRTGRGPATRYVPSSSLMAEVDRSRRP